MVRLKPPSSSLAPLSITISIPYGSIKTAVSASLLLLKYFISIPYGSIKTSRILSMSLSISSFQFLMVRLKLSASYFSSRIRRFQFLVVRLKVPECPCLAINVEFQFLVVRLKVMTDVFNETNIINFNSLWFD